MTISPGPRPEVQSTIGKQPPCSAWCGSTTLTCELAGQLLWHHELSAIQPWPTPFSIASSTTLTASSSVVNRCDEKRLRRQRWLDPAAPNMARSVLPTGSATPADINRNGRPTSIGTGGRHRAGIAGRLHRNAQSIALSRITPSITGGQLNAPC